MVKCKFTTEYYTKYYDYETRKWVDFNCQEMPLSSGFCIFHDKDYLQDKTNYEEHKRVVRNRLKRKINHAISNNEPLLCIEFNLPDFIISDLSSNKEFTKPVYFLGSQFFGKADFFGAKFQEGASFSVADFQGEADFSRAKFQGETYFDRANLQEGALLLFISAKFEGVAILC